ncbi:MAG: STAS domain-containing protein [Acidimicrobiia bacterium]
MLHVGDNAVIMARGDLDLATAPRFEREALATLVLSINGFTFDLSYVTFLDSSGVNVLLKIHRTAVEHGIQVRFEPIPRQGRKVLELCGLVEFFGITPLPSSPGQGGAAA